METIQHIYQLKRGTAQRLQEVNPILLQGEPCFEYDTNRLKIGDGFTPYNSLPFISSGIEIKSFPTYADLPAQGSSSYLYLVIKDSLLYQWVNNSYKALSASGSVDPFNIDIINGGNSTNG